jgi:hypothetical protein
MRRALLTLVAAVAVLAWSAAPAAAQTLDISFRTALIRPTATCEVVFCAPVTVPGYGAGTLTFTDDSFEFVSRSCAEYTGTARVDFVDGTTEPLVMAESGLVCFPGNSANTPGSSRSYGNPFRQTGTFTVESGPAELVGLTGTSDVRFAGADLRGVYSIDLQ